MGWLCLKSESRAVLKVFAFLSLTIGEFFGSYVEAFIGVA